jgi:hypothetical protein
MIELKSVTTGPCDLEPVQKPKEVFLVKIAGEEKHLCWPCLRRLALMAFRATNGKPAAQS